MKYTLRSLEWLNGVEPFQFDKSKNEENEPDGNKIYSGGNEALALMLEWKMRVSEDSDKCTTCDCDVDFSNRQALLEHYQSVWHKTNLRRKLKHLMALDEEEFENYDGNDEDNEPTASNLNNDTQSEDDEFDLCLLPSGRSFFVQNNNVYSVSKSIQHVNEDNVCSSTFSRPFDCAILLWNGGHFAGGIYKNDRLVEHRSFHRYVARAKQGGVQSQYDNSHGNAKSAGAALRRYNEAKMKEEILQLLSSWKTKLSETPLIFLRCASYQRAVFLDSNVGMTRGDERVRSIPFETKRPTAEEIAYTWNRLQFVEEHGTVDKFREELVDLNERRKRVAQKVEKKKRKSMEGNLCDWDGNDDKNTTRKAKNDDNDEKKTDHIKVRKVEPKEADKWPELDAEWRNETYKLMRLDDSEGLKIHMEKINQEFREQVYDYLRTNRITPNNITYLHICASKSLLNVLKFLLDDVNCDPRLKDESGRPPYSMSADKRTKEVFIQYRVDNGDKYTWTQTHIPEPPKQVILTPEEESRIAEKKKEKKQKQKEKAKRKKEEKQIEEEERAIQGRWAIMTEREKRAEAVERRLAGLPPVSRCQQCGSNLLETPFQYSHFKFCSAGCVATHRRANP